MGKRQHRDGHMHASTYGRLGEPSQFLARAQAFLGKRCVSPMDTILHLMNRQKQPSLLPKPAPTSLEQYLYRDEQMPKRITLQLPYSPTTIHYITASSYCLEVNHVHRKRVIKGNTQCTGNQCHQSSDCPVTSRCVKPLTSCLTLPLRSTASQQARTALKSITSIENNVSKETLRAQGINASDSPREAPSLYSKARKKPFRSLWITVHN